MCWPARLEARRAIRRAILNLVVPSVPGAAWKSSAQPSFAGKGQGERRDKDGKLLLALRGNARVGKFTGSILNLESREFRTVRDIPDLMERPPALFPSPRRCARAAAHGRHLGGRCLRASPSSTQVARTRYSVTAMVHCWWCRTDCLRGSVLGVAAATAGWQAPCPSSLVLLWGDTGSVSYPCCGV